MVRQGPKSMKILEDHTDSSLYSSFVEHIPIHEHFASQREMRSTRKRKDGKSRSRFATCFESSLRDKKEYRNKCADGVTNPRPAKNFKEPFNLPALNFFENLINRGRRRLTILSHRIPNSRHVHISKNCFGLVPHSVLMVQGPRFRGDESGKR